MLKNFAIVMGIFAICVTVCIFSMRKFYPTDYLTSKTKPAREETPRERVQKEEAQKAEEVEALNNTKLPRNAWFRWSVWSLIWKYPSANQILAKSISAGGDWSVLQSLNSLSMEGEVSSIPLRLALQDKCDDFFINEVRECQQKSIDPATTNPSFFEDKTNLRNVKGTMSILQELPNKFWMRKATEDEISEKNQSSSKEGKKEITLAYNGRSGWQKEVDFDGSSDNILKSKITGFRGEELEFLKDNSAVSWTSYPDYIKQSTVKGLNIVDGSPCYLIEAASKLQDNNSNNTPQQTRSSSSGSQEGNKKTNKLLCFDVVTGYLSKTQDGATTTFYTDYQLVDGLKLPHQLHFYTQNSGVWTIVKIKQWKTNELYPLELFNKPVR